MVNFAVFNELSLPFCTQYKAEEGFIDFTKLLAEIKKYGFKKVRTENDIKCIKMTKDDCLYTFFNKIKNKTLKDRIRNFLANEIKIMDTPLIKNEYLESDSQILEINYKYNNNENLGGLACAEYWNTLAISFNSCIDWNNSFITLQKDKDFLNIPHASKNEHLIIHQELLDNLEFEIKLGINKNNFWENRNTNFSNIFFLEHIEKEIKKLDSTVFDSFISIMRDIETGRRPLKKLDTSGESNTTNNNSKRRRLRNFNYNGKVIYFEKHIKNLPSGYRIHYLEEPEKLVIGYIGPHLDT